MSLGLTSLLAGVPVIPVLTVERAADAVPLAKALLAGGLRAIEVTLRTSVALQAVRAISTEVPEAVVGIGTITRPGDIVPAIAAGARFLVSPGSTKDLIDAFLESRVPALPGCATVSEALVLAARGFAALKFFPAEASGGLAWLRSVSAPLPDLKFCPTGGIDGRNAGAYLALPNVFAVGGSWVAPQAMIDSGDFAGITRLARAAERLAGPSGA